MAVAVLMAIAACSSTPRGTVTVHLQDAGGPSPGRIFPHGGSVSARRSGDGTVTLVVPRSGTGAFKLVSGDYSFEYRVPPSGICGGARARVKGGHHDSVTVTCPIS
jgi:hypothetical protein